MKAINKNKAVKILAAPVISAAFFCLMPFIAFWGAASSIGVACQAWFEELSAWLRKEPRWLTESDLLQIAKEAAEETGENWLDYKWPYVAMREAIRRSQDQ